MSKAPTTDWAARTPAYLQYILAVLSVVLATALRMAIGPHLAADAPYITYFLSNALVVWFTRLGPSLCAILLSTLAADYFFLPPLYTLLSPPLDYFVGAMFLAASLVMLALAQRQRHANRQARELGRAASERAALLNLAPVLGRDLDDRIIIWGRGAESLYGFSEAEALGRVSHQLLRTEFPETLELIRAQLLSRGDWEGELVHTRKDGVQVSVLSHWAIHRDAEGKPKAILEDNRDISKRKEMEQALREAREQLEQHSEGLERVVQQRTARLQELVGELQHFSYSITHDMRAPLRAMRGFADMVMELCGNCPAKEQRMFLQRISNAAERMDALIRDALNYNRAVRQELSVEEVDPVPLLHGILESYPEFQSCQACITIQPEIPHVLGNKAGLTQCFSNLLGNAIKFVDEGKQPEVRVRAELVPSFSAPICELRPAGAASVRGGGRGESLRAPSFSSPAVSGPPGSDSSTTWVRIWVEDSGIGIPRTMLPRVFNMFSRGTNAYPGTGIGLALVRKVVEHMGGRVGVESELGKGSRFWVDLKLAPTRPEGL